MMAQLSLVSQGLLEWPQGQVWEMFVEHMSSQRLQKTHKKLKHLLSKLFCALDKL